MGIKEKNRIVEYDVFRVILTFLVVIGHSRYLNNSFGIGGTTWVLPKNVSAVYNGVVANFLDKIVLWAYSFHMPLFFALSGAVFCIQWNKFNGNFDKLVVNKFNHLLVPFFWQVYFI